MITQYDWKEDIMGLCTNIAGKLYLGYISWAAGIRLIVDQNHSRGELFLIKPI